jgi:hypothetical protein
MAGSRVERESAGIKTKPPRIRTLGKEFADFIKNTYIGSGGRARGFTEGGLIHLIQGAHGVQAGIGFPQGPLLCADAAAQGMLNSSGQGTGDEGSFTRPGNTCHHGKAGTGHAQIDMAEIVQSTAVHL